LTLWRHRYSSREPPLTSSPSYNTPYLFNFANRQDLSVKYSRHTAKSYYGIDSSSIPGNSDAGAMQTWVLWNMIGLYPLTGQTTFLIGSPWFERLELDLGDGKTLLITSSGGNQEDSFYVQNLKVNGDKWDRAWVTWEDVFANGGRMEFVLGSEAVRWANGTLPPSPAS
jgi:putative alpha-1,2-mannosidase